MHDRQFVWDLHVGTVHLLQRIVVVEERLALDNALELPPHDVGREALAVGHRSLIQLGQFVKTLLGQSNAPTPPRVRHRGELPTECVLLLAVEVLRANRLDWGFDGPIRR